MGIIEGEGTFVRSPGRSIPTLRVSMTDEDTVQTLHGVTGVGHLLELNRREDHWKTPHAWTVSSGGEFDQVARVVAPYLMSRRRERLNELYPNVERVKSRSWKPWSDGAVGWLSGVIDGEGTLDGRGRLVVCMTDLDVLQQCLRLTRFGRLGQPPSLSNPGHGRKPQFLWSVSSRQTRVLIQTLYPLLSARRQHRVDEVLPSLKLGGRSGARTHTARKDPTVFETATSSPELGLSFHGGAGEI